MRKTCLDQVYQLAKKDPRIVFVGSDVAAGTLDDFRREMPDRFFMEGVSEANLIGMMSGLAMNGKILYFNTIAVFLTRRCYEQVLLDAAVHNQKIRLIGSGGGLVYAPLGPTHLAFDDIALMNVIPNMTIVAPCDAEEMKRLMPQTVDIDGPVYIRLGKGGDPVVSSPDNPFNIGQAIIMREGKDALIITTGITLKMALDAAVALESKGISVEVMHMHTVKPLDIEALQRSAAKVSAIITVEEHSKMGGLGSAVATALADAQILKKLKIIALPDAFPSKYGSQNDLLSYYGVKKENIVSSALSLLNVKGACRS